MNLQDLKNKETFCDMQKIDDKNWSARIGEHGHYHYVGMVNGHRFTSCNKIQFSETARLWVGDGGIWSFKFTVVRQTVNEWIASDSDPRIWVDNNNNRFASGSDAIYWNYGVRLYAKNIG